MPIRILLFVIFVCLTPVCADSKTDIFDMGLRYFQTVGNEESIPLGIITALAQDKQGFIWIGTQKGLVRYDGYRLRLFKFNKNKRTSLSGDFISTLWAAPDGKLWIGTRHDGISIFDPVTETFQRYRHQPQAKQGLASNYITAILGDNKGGVWIGTKMGLHQFELKTSRITRFADDNKNSSMRLDNYIGAIFIDNQQRLWVGTARGINRQIAGTLTFESIHSEQNNPASLYGKQINKFYQSDNGNVWIATQENKAAMVDNNDQLHLISKNFNHLIVNDIAEPVKGEIWFATYGGGINIVDVNTAQVISHINHDISITSSLNHDSLGALLVDKSGILWLGTWGNGLNFYNTKNQAFRTLRHSPGNPKGLSYPDIISVLETKNGDLWIGTRSNGIDILTPGLGLIKSYRSDKNNRFSFKSGSISALLETSNGSIWVGTRQSGLYRYQPATDDFKPYTKQSGLSSNEIKRLIEGQKGEIWIGTGAGLDRLDPETDKITHFVTQDSEFSHIQSRFNALEILPDGTLYAGASNGLYCLKPGAKYLEITTHDPTNESSLSHNTVIGLFLDKTQKLWVSTQQGLDKLISWEGKNSRFQSINKLLGYPNQALWANLQKDQQNRIWDGKSIIDLRLRQRRELTKADGVDIGVNWYSGYSKTKSGTLLYAGSKGLLMIRPERFQEWEFSPPVVITQLRIDGKIQPLGNVQHIEFSPEMKSFNLEFSALDFSEPDKNQYAYKLAGYDPEWHVISANNRNASYTNLTPGSYQLHIKGSNRLGVWSDQTINLAITILPKWYQMIWFKFVMLMLICSGLYLIYFLRVRQLHHHKEELRLQVNQRTLELKQSNQSIRTLSDIGNEISSTLDLNKIFNTVYFHINQMMDANVFCIGFYEPENEKIRFKLIIERGKQLPEFSVSMNEAERLAVYCVKYQKPVVINDFKKDKSKYFENAVYIAPKSGEETESVIYWPLIVGGKTIGTITVQSFKKNAYSKQHQEIIRTLAATTANALDNANAYKKSQQAAEIKSAFLANMSHEIRTPMHGILGMTKLISKTNLDIEQKEYVKNIGISANTLLTVINDVLDFSKIEAGKMPLEEKPFGLTSLLNNMSVVIDTIAKDKGVEFDYSISPETAGDFIGDSPRINQILLNLCSNAVKFTEKGKIEVSIKTLSTQAGVCRLQIDVTDNGIGIPPEAIPKLFHSFTQADTSTTRKFGGTGLGLAISRLLARKMEGDITVKSELGKGSCFTLTIKLPVYQPATADNLKLNRPCHVLLHDPNDLSNKIIQHHLTDIGVTTTLLQNLEALQQNKEGAKQRFDLALVSWSADEKTNAKVLTLISDKFKVSLNNTIVFSDKKIHSIIKQVSKHGLENILQKPISIIELQQFIVKQTNRQDEISDMLVKPLAGLKILVAEDNKINQIIANKLLTRKGAKVDMVENGIQAIKQVKNQDYDIILMDIQMPEMDGTEAASIIRQQPEYKYLPIIAMTANVLEDDIAEYKNYGINAHVSKPIDTDDLIAKILKYIKLNKQDITI